MQKIFENKLFIILCLSVLVLFSFVTSCSASYEITLNEQVYKFPDEFGKHDYKLFCYMNGFNGTGTNQQVLIACSDTPFKVYQLTPGQQVRFVNESTFYKYTYSVGTGGNHQFEDIYDFSSNTMSLYDNYNSYYKGYIVDFMFFNCDYSVYSTHDVLDLDGNVVFTGAPVGDRLEPMEMRQVEEIPQAVVEIIKMTLIPCLIIFGTLLVLFLLRSKNFLSL